MKKRLLVFVCVWLSALLLLASNQARARDGPLIPSQHNLPFVPASPKPEPPTEIPLPEELPRIPKAKPTPTISEGTRVTAELKVKRCALYEPIIVRWIEMEKSPDDDFYNLTFDDLPMLMAIMAAESGCDPSVVSSADAIGLFQIIPRDWLPFGKKLKNNSYNIYTGLWMLDRTLTKTGGDWRTTIAWWNCGQPKVEADECGSKGGYNFADHVIEFWKPLFEKE